METHWCILNIIGTDALELKHYAISTRNACYIFNVLVQLNKNVHLRWIKLENKATFENKYPVV